MTTIPSVQSHKPEPVLRIIDIGFDGLSEPSIPASCLEENDLKHVLDSLPTQNSGTARIFVSSFPITREPPGNSVLLHLESLGLQNVKIPKRLDVSDLSQLAPQWQDKANPACFGIKLHSTDDDLCAYVQCIPFGDDKLIAKIVPKTVKYTRFTAFACSNWQPPEQKLIPEAETVQRNWNQALVSSLLQNFCISQSSRSQKEFTKLLILNSLRIGLEFANKALLHPTKTIQLEHRIRRYQGIHQEDLNSRKEASSNYETITDVAQDLSDAVEFVISSITNSITAQDDLQPSKKRISTGLQELFEDTRGLCAQQIRLAARIEAYTDRRYKVYESSLNQKDSDSVKRLTILATVFFPLSLAASMLSMQTRFAKLDVLLYDFFGMGVLLGCLMFVVYHVLVVILNFLKVFERHGRAGLENEYARITDTEREILEREERFTARLRNWPYNFVRVLGFYVMVTFVIGIENSPTRL
ncbi:hypothetical protein L207DRAFT_641218 [Hyaloscypha variabilis F]|uniref:Uncharacterized protein n=1 Tax=Hyaloscypha variabilis (strain UAMH 11265 / GT02V1 / F) TaxID=1149755 RepID=A0A2J6QXT9_HYAVF|nr:hypothetical protein L207DRAFT_641218 [Hyaloscypha variabilis F]